jgi:hypothetical protein
MKITNLTGLPETIVRAMERDAYSKGDAHYSCTELVNPPRITLLKQRHAGEIVEDAADRIWMLLGKLGHKLAEQAGADNALIEERLFMEVAGRRISGASDVAQWVYSEDGKITDYKFTSVWTAIIGDRIQEWEQAQNIYAELFEEASFHVTGLEICAIYRDWRKGEAAQRGEDYPPRAQIIPLKLWPREQRRQFISERVTTLRLNESLPDDGLWECTSRDMWERPTTYAVMKVGRKTAMRVLHGLDEASAWMRENKGEYIETRPGKRVRCEDYCPVNGWCSQFRAYQEQQKTEETPCR